MTNVITILFIELKKMIRGKIAVFLALAPLFLIPALTGILFIGNSALTPSLQEKQIGLISGKSVYCTQAEALIKEFPENVSYTAYTSVKTACADLKQGKIEGIIIINDSDQPQNLPINIVYNSNSITSQLFLSSFSQYLEHAQHEQLQLPAIKNAKLELTDLSYTTESYANYIDSSLQDILISLLPTLLVTFILFSGGTLAIDITAGEKERGTFEDLLLTSANPFSIVSAKTASILIYLLSGMICSCIGFSISILLTRQLNPSVQLQTVSAFPAGSIPALMVLVFTFSLLSASLLIYIGISSKNMRTAGMKLNMVSFIPLLVSLGLLFANPNTFPAPLYICPVAGTMFMIKFILMDTFQPFAFLLVNTGNMIFFILLIVLTSNVFTKEEASS